jgi:hypothetical protein
MPVKARGRGQDPAVHRWGEARPLSGFTWVAHPGEGMRRASHALAVDGDVWVVEPVDAAGLDDMLADLGTVAGVVVLADYHRRDAPTVARRLDVPVVLPPSVEDLRSGVESAVSTFEESLAAAGFEALPLYGGRPWSEAALYHPPSRTLVATEALVTAPDLTAPDERLAVSPYARLLPPRGPLSGLDVDRVLVGHGAPVLEDADAALAAALEGAEWGAPRAIVGNLPYLVRAVSVALRD